VLSNFPIYTFDRLDGRAPLWPTFGVTVVPELDDGVAGIGGLVPVLKPLQLFGQSLLLENLITTILVGHDQTYLNQPWVSVRAIKVDPTDIGVLDFGISRDRLEVLYENGYTATQQFLSTWDWPAYLQRFRVSHYPGASSD
jgi:NTE family protein